MNASSWKKAAVLVAKVIPESLQVQATATAKSQHLQSLPLNALAVDYSGPLQVTYDYQQPIATSTPRATSTETPEMPTEAYCQILPGMSDRLYPTLVADSSLDTHVPDNHGTLQTQLTSEVDKYLQEAAERCERDVNYFDGWHMAMNTTNQQQEVESVEHEEEKTPARMVKQIQNITFNTMMNWKQFLKKVIKNHQQQCKMMSMRQTQYRTPQGTLLMNSSIQPSMTPLKTQ